MSGNRVCHFKLVLLGDTAVGKSCLVVRFVRDEFFEFQEPTIGGEFLAKTFFSPFLLPDWFFSVRHRFAEACIHRVASYRMGIRRPFDKGWSIGYVFSPCHGYSRYDVHIYPPN